MDSADRLYVQHRAVHALGQIRLVDDTGPVQTAQIGIGAWETKDSTPVLHDYGFSSNPPPGADVALAFIAGNRTNGYVVATGHQTYRVRNLSSGEVIVHDDRGQSIYLAAAGITINGGGNQITVTNTPLVRLESSLHVTGDIVDNCDTQSETLASQRAIYDEHTHVIENIEPGSATISTQPPTQQET